MRPEVLILGGTSEAAELGRRLAEAPQRFAVTTSLAGRTAAPAPLPGRVRIGGFGGVDGLARWLQANRTRALIDATHPFAARMPWHAVEAAHAAGLPHLRLERPAWKAVAGDRWTSVPDLAAAAAAIEDSGRVFLTTGRQDLAPFAVRLDAWFLVRSIEPPGPLPFPSGEVVLARGPFTVADEEQLMARFHIDALVTKNSGAAATAAKLEAARRLGIRVIMVERPEKPHCASVPTVEAALDWLDGMFPELRQVDQIAGTAA